MTNRVLLTSGNLKVSKPGVNVLTASSNNLLFDSNDGFGVFLTGTATLAFGASTTINFPYDLGYYPVVMIHYIFSDGLIRFDNFDPRNCKTKTNALRLTNGTSEASITIRYVVFYTKGTT